MENINVMVIHYVYHCTRQCGFVRWIVKQRIGWNPHLMVKYISMETRQTYRLLVCNKMNIVSYICKRFSQFCCQYSTSAKCGVTNDGYVHIFIFIQAQKTIVQFTDNQFR